MAAKIYQPPDWLKGSTTVGKQYTAYNTYGQGSPDKGVGLGPGEPYHEVQKKVPTAPKTPAWGTLPPAQMVGQPSQVSGTDPRIEAIRRRLRGI